VVLLEVVQQRLGRVDDVFRLGWYPEAPELGGIVRAWL